MKNEHNSGELINQLFSIRNQFGKKFVSQKVKLLNTLSEHSVRSKKELQLYADTLHFLLAYPDNKTIYRQAIQCLEKFQIFIQSNEKLKESLFNSGITGTSLCAAFSFEIAKWMRKNYPENIRLSSFEADEGQIQSILSVVMPKVESEIFQDANASWRPWFKHFSEKGEILLDKLIAVFDETDIQPGVKDELWNAIGINLEIDFSNHTCLPDSLFTPYFHLSLVNRKYVKQQQSKKPIRVNLNEKEAAQIIDNGRMVLLRQLREIDPITFTSANLISYYKMSRGISVALMGMVPERRHPIDSYMGYVVFKNGLPVAYAGSWILFDSARIGLNVFPAYRGGESQFIFEQVLILHREVYNLKRFTVDPYQLGKENSDGIHSGSFWVYYRSGFRPVKKEQKQLAEEEFFKIKSIKGYHSSASVLKKLADSRSELLLKKGAVNFDATDLSIVYASILKNQYNNNRKQKEEQLFKKLADLLRIKNYQEERMQFILKNWCMLLLSGKNDRLSQQFKKKLKKLFELKAYGSEEEYIKEMQKAGELRKILESKVKENIE